MNYNLLSESSYILLDDFALCNIRMNKGWVGIHEVSENKGLYYYLYSGSPKVGIAFESTLINLTKGVLTPTKPVSYTHLTLPTIYSV